MPPLLTDPPFYFKRVMPAYDGPDEVVYHGIPMHVVGLDRGLTIYGHKHRVDDPEDQDHIRLLEARGWFYTWSFSVMCVDGEPGSHPLSEVEEITAAEFESARAAGWS